MRSAEQFFNEMARMQPLPQELDVQTGAVYAKVHLQRGIKFGPYPMKWTDEPLDKQMAWEVSFFCFIIDSMVSVNSAFMKTAKLRRNPADRGQNAFVWSWLNSKIGLSETEIFIYSLTCQRRPLKRMPISSAENTKTTKILQLFLRKNHKNKTNQLMYAAVCQIEKRNRSLCGESNAKCCAQWSVQSHHYRAYVCARLISVRWFCFDWWVKRATFVGFFGQTSKRIVAERELQPNRNVRLERDVVTGVRLNRTVTCFEVWTNQSKNTAPHRSDVAQTILKLKIIWARPLQSIETSVSHFTIKLEKAVTNRRSCCATDDTSTKWYSFISICYLTTEMQSQVVSVLPHRKQRKIRRDHFNDPKIKYENWIVTRHQIQTANNVFAAD